jgi:hypothetical protein
MLEDEIFTLVSIKRCRDPIRGQYKNFIFDFKENNMESFFLIYITVMGLALTMIAFSVIIRSDETVSRKWAKVRVRVDEFRRDPRVSEPHDEGFDRRPFTGWLVAGAALLLIAIILGNA